MFNYKTIDRRESVLKIMRNSNGAKHFLEILTITYETVSTDFIFNKEIQKHTKPFKNYMLL